MGKRNLFVLLTISVLLLGLTAVGFANTKYDQPQEYKTPADYQQATGNTIDSFQEAPILAEKVKAGELAPLEERMTSEPAVVVPLEEVGQYGGTIRRAWRGPSDHWGLRKFLGERFVGTTSDGQVIPNVAKDFEILDNGAKYVFHLREGMRWSDGHPFTAADVEFWWEIKGDPRLYFPHRDALIMDGEMGKFEVIDDYTFSITFPRPNGTFLTSIAGDGRIRMAAPKHYLTQFHPDYTDPAEVDRMAKERGFDSWESLFDNMYQWPDRNPQRPVITAWYTTNDPTDSYYIFERNPYYWKVDTEGNQLPYIDRITNELVTDGQMVVMKTLSGEVDFQNRGIVFEDYPMLMENRETGDYRVNLYPGVGQGSSMGFYFNQNSKDPAKAELLTDVRFRRALSSAIDREEINEIFFFGIGSVRQASFTTASPFYDEEWSNAYIEYNPELANQLLDEMGLELGSDGIRRMPNGDPVSIFVENADGLGVDILEVIASQWREVGVQMNINTPERSLYMERTSSGDFDIAIWGFDRSLRPDILPRFWAVSASGGGYHWGPLWNQWYATDGEQGVEPPADVKRMHEIMLEIQNETDFDNVKELMAEVTEFHKENLFIIGTIGELPSLVVVQNSLRNVPNRLPWDEMYRSPMNAISPQFFFKK